MSILPEAKEEYLRLLRVPVNTWERHYSQRYLAFLRQFIADAEDRTEEEVQKEYEQLARD